jgi:hypothetical protein
VTEEGMPSEDQIKEQLRQLRIDDVLLQTVVTLINLSGRKLTVEDEKDLGQAKKGIEAARVLMPLCPEEQIQPIKDALSQLQMVYVRETQGPGEEAATPPEAPPPPKPDIWTPGSQ